MISPERALGIVSLVALDAGAGVVAYGLISNQVTTPPPADAWAEISREIATGTPVPTATATPSPEFPPIDATQDITPTPFIAPTSTPIPTPTLSPFEIAYNALIPARQIDREFTFGTIQGVLSWEQPYTMVYGTRFMDRFGGVFAAQAEYPVKEMPVESGMTWGTYAEDFEYYQDDPETGHGQIIVRTNRMGHDVVIIGHSFRVPPEPLSMQLLRGAWDWVGKDAEKMKGYTMYFEQTIDGTRTTVALDIIDMQQITQEEFDASAYIDPTNNELRIDADTLGIPVPGDYEDYITLVFCEKSTADPNAHTDRIMVTLKTKEVVRQNEADPVGDRP